MTLSVLGRKETVKKLATCRPKRERRVSFERMAELIGDGNYIDISRHPSRANQRVFVLRIDGYVWAVPYVVEGNEESIFLITAFPSRKLNRRYGE